MSVNGGYPAPPTHPTEPPGKRCCAKCRRGTPAMGELPCGYALNCPCHTRRTR